MLNCRNVSSGKVLVIQIWGPKFEKQKIVVHACNANTEKAESGRSLGPSGQPAQPSQ